MSHPHQSHQNRPQRLLLLNLKLKRQQHRRYAKPGRDLGRSLRRQLQEALHLYLQHHQQGV